MLVHNCAPTTCTPSAGDSRLQQKQQCRFCEHHNDACWGTVTAEHSLTPPDNAGAVAMLETALASGAEGGQTTLQFAHSSAMKPAMSQHSNTHYTNMPVHPSHGLRLRPPGLYTTRGVPAPPCVLASLTPQPTTHSELLQCSPNSGSSCCTHLSTPPQCVPHNPVVWGKDMLPYV